MEDSAENNDESSARTFLNLDQSSVITSLIPNPLDPVRSIVATNQPTNKRLLLVPCIWGRKYLVDA